MADLGQHGLTLLAQFEAGPGGKPATEAYECSGGRYTLGLGATTWPDGSDVKPYDRCTMDQAIELTNWNVRRFADAVDRTIKVPISTNERDAMIMLAYNVGAEAFADCSVANRLNANPKNREYAAAAFAMWCKATNDVPDKPDLNEVFYQDVIGTNAKGKPCWVGPAVNPPKGWNVVRDGDEFWGVDPADASQIVPLGIKPVKYQKAIPGLLRRHLSEACLFLGLDWRQACRKDTVSITSRRVWDSVDRRWEDLVSKKTEVADVLAMARQHPLGADALANPAPLPAPAKPIPELELDTPAAPPQAAAKAGAPEPATQPAPAFPAPEQKPAVSGPSAAPEAPKAAAPAKVPPAIIPVPPVVAGQGGTKPPHPDTKMPDGVPYGVDLKAGAKPMEATERFVGSAMMWVANGLRVGAANGMKFTGFAGFVVALFLDMMKSPVTAALILSTIVAAVLFVVWLFGVILEKSGLKKKKKAEVVASQLMY